MMHHHFLPSHLLLALALAGCGTPSSTPPKALAVPDEWYAVALPGKPATRYDSAVKDGRSAVAAVSERSASLWRRTLQVPATDLGEVSFSWWVPAPVEGAHLGEADTADAAARVMFAFAGDIASLPMRTRMLYDLAEALTGEQPPYATLMYVWDSQAPVGSIIVNPRTDRVRKIVVDSGREKLGRWRDHRRNLAADFRLAFGEDPGALQSVALMTDSDNTRSRALAWYGPVQLLPPVAAAPATGSATLR
jgi:hypothetical protein